MGCFEAPPPPPAYFAQSLRNRYFRLVPVAGIAILSRAKGGGWGRFCQLLVVDLTTGPAASALVLNSTVHLHADDAAVCVDVDRA
jgi:hypothetical protein